MSAQSPPPEFSVEIELDALPRGGKTVRLQANRAERAAVAKRLGALSLEKLEGDVRLVATPTTIVAKGRIEAELVRECVVSLEEMKETIDEALETEFVRAGPDADSAQIDEDWDAPEVHEGGIFDAGEFLVQQLSLAMDPFPRKPDAPSLAEKYGRAAESSPFSGLAEKLEKSEKNQ